MGQSSKNTRLRRTAMAIAVVVLVAPALIAAPGDDTSPHGALQVALLAVLGAIVMFVVFDLGRQLAGVDRQAVEIAQRLASDADQQRLLVRWLERARWARFVGGCSGLLAWFLGTKPHGDVLLFGTGGLAAGAVLAELHHIRRARGPRTARIEVRAVGDYLLDSDARRMLGVAVAAGAAALIGAWSAETRTATWWGLAALASLGVARLAQHRVATRARPAVSDKLTRADDLARELAIGRGLARPATFFALAVVARACFALEPMIGGFSRALGAAAWLYALFLWWHNRRLGLDFLMTEHREPLLA